MSLPDYDRCEQRWDECDDVLAERNRLRARVAELEGIIADGAWVQHHRARIEELEGALADLANEADGFLSQANADDHGLTNIRCLNRRIDDARAALAPSTPPPAPLGYDGMADATCCYSDNPCPKHAPPAPYTGPKCSPGCGCNPEGSMTSSDGSPWHVPAPRAALGEKS